MSFSELLKLEKNKEKLEDHIMEMILENPVKAAETLSELFNHESEVKSRFLMKHSSKEFAVNHYGYYSPP